MTPPERGLRQSVFDGLIWGIGGKAAVIAGNFLVLMVTSRTLSAVEFGVFAAATVFADLSWALATSAIGIGLVQKKDLTSEETAAGFVAFAAVALGLGFVMIVGAPAFERLFQAPGLQSVLWAMAGASVLKVMTGYYGALLQRRLDLRYYQMTQNLPQLIGGCVLTVVGALLGWGIWALVGGFALTAVMELVLTAWRARAPHRLPASTAAFASLLDIGGAMVVNRMANFFATSIDRVIIGATLGPAALGVYTRASSLMMAPVKLIGLAMQRTFLPVFSRIQDDEKRLGAALEQVLAVQPVVFIPVGVGLIIAAPALVFLVLGDGWSQVVLPAQILMGALGARLGYVVSETAAIAIGEATGAARRQIVYGLLVVIGALVGLSQGLAGVALGVTLALSAFYVLSLRRAVVRLGCSVREIVAGHLRGAAVAALAFIVARAAHDAIHIWASARAADLVEIAIYGLAVAAILFLAPSRLLGAVYGELRSEVIAVALRALSPKPTLPRRQNP